MLLPILVACGTAEPVSFDSEGHFVVGEPGVINGRELYVDGLSGTKARSLAQVTVDRVEPESVAVAVPDGSDLAVRCETTGEATITATGVNQAGARRTATIRVFCR
jgi:hypothetical protein